MLQEINGRHGPMDGAGIIKMVLEGGATRMMEYHYSKGEDGSFRGSISAWDRVSEDAGLTAIMSRSLPTRQAMMQWIFDKAEKLAASKE